MAAGISRKSTTAEERFLSTIIMSWLGRRFRLREFASMRKARSGSP
jgi:hypothetical protein